MEKLLTPLKQSKFMKLMVIYTRYLLGYAFIHGSIPKIMNERFTTIPIDNPVGFFFEGMYQSGYYWQFLGWAQLISGLLLVFQRFSTLGALVYFPIILNIFIITAALHFTGTPYITGLMLFGTLCLLIWDYDKLKYLLFPDTKSFSVSYEMDPFMIKPVWVYLGIAMIVMEIFEVFIFKKFLLIFLNFGLLGLVGLYYLIKKEKL